MLVVIFLPGGLVQGGKYLGNMLMPWRRKKNAPGSAAANPAE